MSFCSACKLTQRDLAQFVPTKGCSGPVEHESNSTEFEHWFAPSQSAHSVRLQDPCGSSSSSVSRECMSACFFSFVLACFFPQPQFARMICESCLICFSSRVRATVTGRIGALENKTDSR